MRFYYSTPRSVVGGKAGLCWGKTTVDSVTEGWKHQNSKRHMAAKELHGSIFCSGMRVCEPKCSILTATQRLLPALLIYQVLFPFWVQFCRCTGPQGSSAPTTRPCPGSLSPPTPGQPQGFSDFISIINVWQLAPAWGGSFYHNLMISDSWEPLQWQNTFKIIQLKED